MKNRLYTDEPPNRFKIGNSEKRNSAMAGTATNNGSHPGNGRENERLIIAVEGLERST